MKRSRKSSHKLDSIVRWLSSRNFFTLILIFFIFETLWLVFSAVYPMPFDEAYHFGIIKLYSHQFSPFFSTQPPNSDQFSALTHDPSFLYHYLMSYPYRLVVHFTTSQTIQVICLRLINVAIFSWAIVVFRKTLIKARLSGLLTNLSLLVFIFIPVVPLLGAEISYDNLLILLVAFICLNMVSVIKEARSRNIALKPLLAVAIFCLFASVDQYAFLPIFIATVVFLLGMYGWVYRGHYRKIWGSIYSSWANTAKLSRVLLLSVLAIGCWLNFMSYGLNVIDYRNPIPDCSTVLSVNRCQAYSPWDRNYAENLTIGNFKPDPPRYIGSFFLGMWFRSFFAINGNTPVQANQGFSPLPIVSIGAIELLSVGIALTVINFRKIFRPNWLAIYFGMIILLYLLVLILDGYSNYLLTGQINAINGRYLIPILIPMAYIFGLAVHYTFAGVKVKSGIIVISTVVLLFGLLEGGGISGFIVNSNQYWYWPNSVVQQVNWRASTIANRVIIGKKYLPYLH